jgi:hypothetical protein
VRIDIGRSVFVVDFARKTCCLALEFCEFFVQRRHLSRDLAVGVIRFHTLNGFTDRPVEEGVCSRKTGGGFVRRVITNCDEREDAFEGRGFDDGFNDVPPRKLEFFDELLLCPGLAEDL